MNCVLLGLKGILDQLPRAHASEFRPEVSESTCIIEHNVALLKFGWRLLCVAHY